MCLPRNRVPPRTSASIHPSCAPTQIGLARADHEGATVPAALVSVPLRWSGNRAVPVKIEELLGFVEEVLLPHEEQLARYGVERSSARSRRARLSGRHARRPRAVNVASSRGPARPDRAERAPRRARASGRTPRRPASRTMRAPRKGRSRTTAGGALLR